MKETVEFQFKELQQHLMITMEMVTELLRFLSAHRHITFIL